MRSYPFSRILICFVLILGLVFGSALPSFAATSVDQETLYPYLRTNYNAWFYKYNGGHSNIATNTGLGTMFAYLGEGVSQTLYYIYTSVDGIESSLATISGKIKDYTTVLSNISGYVDGLEGYVDGLESAFSTNNSRLQSILTAVQGITTYNYNSVLNSILANTEYLGSIESHLEVTNSSLGTSNSNGIWGSTYSTAVASNSILDKISDFTSTSVNVIWRSAPGTSIIDNPNNNGRYSIGGFSYPSVFTNATNNESQYRYKSNNNNQITLLDGLENLSIIGNFTLSKIFTPYTRYTYRNYDPETGTFGIQLDSNNNPLAALSVMDLLWYMYSQDMKFEENFLYLYADDDTIQRKKDNAELTSGALDQITGDGSAAASLSDFTSVSSGLGDIKSSVSGGASASSAFAVLNGGSNAWDWFSTDCQDDLDTTEGSSSSRSRSLKSVSSGSSSSTPFLDEYYSSVLSFLGGGSDD